MKNEVTPAERALVNLVRGINNADENEAQLYGICGMASKVNAYHNCYNEALELYLDITDRMKKETQNESH